MTDPPPTNTAQQWNRRYEENDTPWDTDLVSLELLRALEQGEVSGHRVLDLGCGTGTNTLHLAQLGFDVTGVDIAENALIKARAKMEQAGVTAQFIQADICDLPEMGEPFDFVLDRGCYHCVRRTNLPGFISSLSKQTLSESHYLLLTGNASELREHGPPGVTEQEIREELGELFLILRIRAFRFEDPGEVEGPLGWSCLLRRK